MTQRSTSMSRIPSSPGESKIPRPGGILQKSASLPRGSSIPRPIFGQQLPEQQKHSFGSLTSEGLSQDDTEQQFWAEQAINTDKVLVTVRIRPISERERSRGDREVWVAADHNTIGVQEGAGSMKVKFAFDTVFGNTASNKQVYNRAAKGVVAAAMDGLNATIFAYGVTSSGKTYTMMGCQDDPGVVQRAIRDVFKAIEQSPERDFLLRFSMMEIYNEVLNDMLDPARANLKLREDPVRGFFVENMKEETLVSVDHALSVIAAGDAHRKVSATAYNEGSSRSHTIMRLSIESSERPGPDADPRIHVARTLSFLNLIDLAGSESAKATLTKGHVREGSYINKSLLTLGTVIGKLSDGNAVHIPFRDSKLTRLLQSSMTGSGARVSVVATATPASSQAEETHNTLKFATRAKKIEIHAQRNEILDQSSLIMRYQAEIAALRRQLEEAAQGKGVAMIVDPLHPEVRNLRERLEEEHQALLQREQDKAVLEVRIARLTRIILHSTRIAKPNPSFGYRYRQLLLQECQLVDGDLTQLSPNIRKPHILIPARSTPVSAASDRTRSSDAGSEQSGPMTPVPQEAASPLQRFNGRMTGAASLLTPSRDSPVDVPTWDRTPDVAGTIASIRSAGDLFAGSGLLNQLHTRYAPSEADPDTELLREQMRVMADELDKRESLLEALRNGDALAHELGHDSLSLPDEDQEVELQIMAAEREFLESKLKRANTRQQELVGHIRVLRRQLMARGIQPEVGAVRLRQPDEASSSSGDSEALSDDEQYRTPEEAKSPEQPSPRLIQQPDASAPEQDQHVAAATAAAAAAAATAQEAAAAQQKLAELEARFRDAKAETQQREAELRAERAKLQRVTEREHRVEVQLKTMAKEGLQLRNELGRLEGLNNNLQGYALDDMSNEELSNLINSLTQAVERVRVTVQMRRLATTGQKSPRPERETSVRPASAAQAPPPQHGRDPSLGPYAPMSMNIGSLARAVSSLNNGTEVEEKSSARGSAVGAQRAR